MSYKTGKLNSVLWLVGMGVIALAVYWPYLNAPYFGDDYQFVFDKPASKILYYFAHRNPQNGFYRPIQASFLAVVQMYKGMQTWPIHLTQIGLHVVLARLVYVVIMSFGFSRLQAGIGAVFMLLSQASVHSVLSNDTLSQVGGTLFGCLSLWFLYRSYGGTNDGAGPSGWQKRINHKCYIAGVVMLLLSLFSKETSVSFPLMAVVVVLLANLRITRSASAVTRAVVDLLPYALATGLYLVVRSAVVETRPAFGPDLYNFHIGVNVIRNLAMCAFALLVPVSTVAAFSMLKYRLLVVFGAVGILTLVFSVLVALGLWRANQRTVIVLMVCFALLGLFPVVLLNHMGELYVYNSMPFVAVLVGIGLGQLWMVVEPERIGRVFLMLAVCLVVASHVVAVRSKARLMDDNGRRTAALLEQVRPFVDNAPPNGRLWLLNPPVEAVEYSVFHVRGFSVLISALRIPHLWNRPDLEMRIIYPAQMQDNSTPDGTLVLTLEGDEVVVWPRQ